MLESGCSGPSAASSAGSPAPLAVGQKQLRCEQKLFSSNCCPFSHLVGFDEPDKRGEEHGGWSCFAVLAKVFDGGLIKVLEDRILSSYETCSDLHVKSLTVFGGDLGRFPISC